MKAIPYILLSASILVSLNSCNSKQSPDQAYQMPEEVSNLPVGTEIGNRAPEIVLPSINGEMMKLSDLKGKVVLVDFWASWCTPCRKENPVLVEAYSEFKQQEFTAGKGFEIFSISLDKDKNKWKEAVEKDALSWSYMLSDLKAAKSKPALDYAVQMIPSNFLLDQHGVIIAKNLRSEALREKLESLLKE